MKKYRVKVNGKVYEVELEAVSEEKGTVAAKPVETPAKVSTPVSAPVSGGRKVLAPIGGSIIKINVEVGTQVKKGQCLLLIEAMKLENEVVAPCDGTVSSVAVSKGNNVNNGDLLVVIG